MTFNSLRAGAMAFALVALGGSAVWALLFGASALAQGVADTADTTVTWSWGEWIAAFLGWGAAVVIALYRLGKQLAPAPVRFGLDLVGADRLVESYVDLAVNAVDGAVKGRELTVDVGNAVFARALRMAEERGDELVEAIGGNLELQRRIVAKLTLEPQAVVVEHDGKLAITRAATAAA